MSDEKIATAFHEAGHVCVALALGSKIVAVEIEPRPHAHCFHRNKAHNAITALAGAIAEHRAVASLDCGDAVDFATAYSIAKTLSPNDVFAQFARFRIAAQDLVDAHWPQVEIIANALLAAGKLTGHEIDALIQGMNRRAAA